MCSARRQRRTDVDALRGDMHLVAALGQPADEAERHQAVAVRQVIGQQLRRVGDEDGERGGPAAGSFRASAARSRANELTSAPR